ncbi:MAG: DRTGG domain-containing protein [Clostridia bacterium]|nr:DRTGG domain-containing protein [Clostridia bacterium]
MNVRDFVKQFDLKVVSGENNLDKEISGVYVCDLLSWVMSHANRGDIWITVLTHLNVVAVAMLTEVSCIVIPEGIDIEEATIKKAGQEGIILLSTSMSAYEVCCQAFQSGIKGRIS